MANQIFQTYHLVHSSPNEVYNWLEENKPARDSFLFGSNREELEEALIARNEPLIHLGLALFGSEAKTGVALFQSGDTTIKKAVLAGTTVSKLHPDDNSGNSWVESTGELSKLLDGFDEELLVSLVANEYITDELLTNLYERKAPFDKLDDEKWYTLLRASIRNPRIGSPYVDITWNGFDAYHYHKVFTSAWKLFAILPTDYKHADLLGKLGERLVPDKPSDMDVMAAVKRWQVEEKEDYSPYKNYSPYEWCRFAIAKLVTEHNEQFRSFKESDDIALRLAYYSRCRDLKPKEVREMFEKDRDRFLDVALGNNNFYRTKDVRNELDQCCWDYYKDNYDRAYPADFDRWARRYTEEHPEWFVDWDSERPLDEIEDPMSRANLQLNLLNERAKTISEKLTEREDGNQQSLMDDVRNLLTDTNTYLLQLSGAKAPVWGWIFGGIIIGYIIGSAF